MFQKYPQRGFSKFTMNLFKIRFLYKILQAFQVLSFGIPPGMRSQSPKENSSKNNLRFRLKFLGIFFSKHLPCVSLESPLKIS